MQDSLLAFVQTSSETKAVSLVVLLFLSTLPFCFYKRNWPDTTLVTLMSLGAVTAVAGIKIIVLALLLPVSQMGQFGDAKTALLLGGLISLIVSSKETVASWRAITHL